jgi:hypothetical protein
MTWSGWGSGIATSWIVVLRPLATWASFMVGIVGSNSREGSLAWGRQLSESACAGKR